MGLLPGYFCVCARSLGVFHIAPGCVRACMRVRLRAKMRSHRCMLAFLCVRVWVCNGWVDVGEDETVDTGDASLRSSFVDFIMGPPPVQDRCCTRKH